MKTVTLILFSVSLLGWMGCSSILDSNKDLLVNSRWEIYGYKDGGLMQMLPLTDTLEFKARPTYYYNKEAHSYDLFTTSNGNQTVRLQLANTRFGTLTGLVQTSSIGSGTILGETFTRPTDQAEWQLWFRKIN